MYREVLVPLDGSRLAECALEHVRSIAKGCQVSKVVLLMVLEPLLSLSTPHDDTAVKRVREAEERFEAESREYLSKVAGNLKKDGIAVGTRLVVGGEAAAKILEAAREEKVDLIIMSTHGRSGISSWVFGSVAERVVRHSTVPVLIVSPCGFRK